MNGRVAVLRAYGGEFELREYPVPEVEPGAILVKLTRAGICGSDLHIRRGEIRQADWRERQAADARSGGYVARDRRTSAPTVAPIMPPITTVSRNPNTKYQSSPRPCGQYNASAVSRTQP